MRKNTALLNKGRSVRTGFTIMEIIVALSILAMLMTAMGFAFDASVKNYTTNENLYKSVNNARQALHRITTELRSAQAVAASEVSTQLSLVTALGDDVTYVYDANANTLKLITNDDSSDSDYVVCRNVTGVVFNRTTVPDQPGMIKDVQISISITIGDVSRTVSTAAVLRRNMIVEE